MTAQTVPSLIDVDPELLERWISDGEAVLVDVREPFERAEEWIAGSVPEPLSAFDAAGVGRRNSATRVVFQCKGGKRSADAAGRFCADGEPVYHLAGGIEAWKASGRPVSRPAKKPGIGVMRQVQIVAGTLVASGVGLGVALDPWWLVVPGFVGCGLVFAGTTGWCGMAMLLGRMPWNRADLAKNGAASASACGVSPAGS